MVYFSIKLVRLTSNITNKLPAHILKTAQQSVVRNSSGFHVKNDGSPSCVGAPDPLRGCFASGNPNR